MRWISAILVLTLCQCSPKTDVIVVGSLRFHINTPFDQDPFGDCDTIHVVLRDAQRQLKEGHFTASEDLAIGPVDDVASHIELVLEGYQGQSLKYRGASGLVATEQDADIGVFFAKIKSFAELGAGAPLDVEDHVAFTLDDGRVLIAGGIKVGTNTVQSRVQMYDPTTASFSDVGSLSIARRESRAAQLGDGRVLFIGGKGGTDQALATVDVYDPVRNTLTTAASADIKPRAGACAFSQQDGGVVTAYGMGPSTALNDYKTIDQSLHVTSFGLAPGSARYNHRCVQTPAGYLIAGGEGTAASSYLKFDDFSETNFTVLTLPYAFTNGEAVVQANGDVLLLCGNQNQGDPIRIDADRAFADSDWKTDYPRHGCAAVLLDNGSILSVGGQVDSSTAIHAELLNGTGVPDLIDGEIVARKGHTLSRLPGGQVLVVGGPEAPTQIYTP